MESNRLPWVIKVVQKISSGTFATITNKNPIVDYLNDCYSFSTETKRKKTKISIIKRRKKKNITLERIFVFVFSCLDTKKQKESIVEIKLCEFYQPTTSSVMPSQWRKTSAEPTKTTTLKNECVVHNAK